MTFSIEIESHTFLFDENSGFLYIFSPYANHNVESFQDCIIINREKLSELLVTKVAAIEYFFGDEFGYMGFPIVNNDLALFCKAADKYFFNFITQNG